VGKMYSPVKLDKGFVLLVTWLEKGEEKIIMKRERIPVGIYLKWIREYKQQLPVNEDTWDKYLFLNAKTCEYFRLEHQGLLDKEVA